MHVYGGISEASYGWNEQIDIDDSEDEVYEIFEEILGKLPKGSANINISD